METVNNECVVTFKSGKRIIAMYFTETNGDLELQMSVEPEMKDGEEPDLPMLLASTLMNAIQAENEDKSNPKVYDGQD